MSGKEKNSKPKNNGVAHEVLDRLVKFQASWEGKLSEVVKKHNDLAAQIAGVEAVVKQVAAFTAAELGKLGGATQRQLSAIAESAAHIDKNVLALAELSKELVGQLTQIDFIFRRMQETGTNKVSFEFSEEDTAQIKADALQRYNDWVASSFKTVREKLEAEDKALRERIAAEEKEAKEAAEKAAAVEAEAKTVETELRKVGLDELTLSGQTSGGQGSPFPEGAVIFGEP